MASFVAPLARSLRSSAVALAALSLVIAACQSTDHSGVCAIQARDYDESCTVDTDCAGVVEIYSCGGCACQTGAVNQRAFAKYQADLETPLSLANGGTCNCPCIATAPHCCSGVCTNFCGCPPPAATNTDAGASTDAGGD